MLKPKHDWLVIEVIKKQSKVVATSDVEDANIKGKVLAVGPGVWYQGTFVEPKVEVGETVYWGKFKDSDTPQELSDKGLALVREIHLIAEETEDA